MSFPSGDVITNISLATSERWIDKTTGERKERTEWHRVVFRNKPAVQAFRELKKGDRIWLEGALKHKKAEHDGIVKYFTEIHARRFELC